MPRGPRLQRTTISRVERWEHRTVLINRGASGWLIEYADGTRLEGLDQVLDEYGAKGWELVTLIPQTYATAAGQFGPFDVSAYRAVFKRRLSAPEAAP
jgi:hypothetical protein